MRWFYSISFKLFVVCFAFVMFTAIVLDGLAYRYIKNEITESKLENARMLMTKEKQYLDMYFLLFQNTLNSLSSSLTALPRNEEDVQALLGRFYDMNATVLSDLYVLKADLSTIGGSIVSQAFSAPSPERKPIYDSSKEKPYSISISPLYKSSTSGWTVTFSLPVKLGSEPVVLAMDLNLFALERKLAEISGNTALSLAILDLRGHVIAMPSNVAEATNVDQTLRIGGISSTELVTASNDVLRLTTTDSPITLIKTIIPQYQWVVLAIVDESDTQRALQHIDAFFVKLLLLGTALSLVLALFIARYIRVPIQYLTRKMKLVRGGDLQVKVSHARKDEFGELALSFDEMLARIRLLIADLNRTERFKKEMEIQALQSQINPHFLYNTLGSISNAVAMGKSDEVDRMIEALIHILEYGITDFSEKATLEEELSNIRDYLYIQNMRYDCVFELELNVDPGLLSFRVLKMILQPIVENSIFHGYSGGRRTGGIRIDAFKSDDDVFVDIIDSGYGIPEEKLDALLQPYSNRVHPKSRKRIGLYNIHQRIRLYYGQEYGVAVTSRVGEGTRVRLSFPGRNPGEAEGAEA